MENKPKFQAKVLTFVEANELEIPIAYRMLDLVSELGEISKEILKGSAYGKTPFQQTAAWQEELGDVMFSLACIANSTGVNLEKALEDALEKYEKRIAVKGSAGSE